MGRIMRSSNRSSSTASPAPAGPGSWWQASSDSGWPAAASGPEWASAPKRSEDRMHLAIGSHRIARVALVNRTADRFRKLQDGDSFNHGCERVSSRGDVRPRGGKKTVLKSVFFDSRSLNAVLKSVITDSRSVFTDSRSLFTDSRSVFTDSQSVFTDSQSVFTDSQSVFTDSRSQKMPRDRQGLYCQRRFTTSRMQNTKSPRRRNYPLADTLPARQSARAGSRDTCEQCQEISDLVGFEKERHVELADHDDPGLDRDDPWTRSRRPLTRSRRPEEWGMGLGRG
jgi:hypothetical protein